MKEGENVHGNPGWIYVAVFCCLMLSGGGRDTDVTTRALIVCSQAVIANRMKTYFH